MSTAEKPRYRLGELGFVWSNGRIIGQFHEGKFYWNRFGSMSLGGNVK